jgi:hypothetical protein
MKGLLTLLAVSLLTLGLAACAGGEPWTRPREKLQRRSKSTTAVSAAEEGQP